MVSLKKWLYGLMFGILVMGWFLIQSQDVVFWVPSFKWDIQGKLEKDWAVLSMGVDKNVTLRENIVRLFYPTGRDNDGKNIIFDVIKNLTLWVMIIFIVLSGASLLINRDSKEVSKSLKSLLYIMLWWVFIYAANWLFWSVLNFDYTNGGILPGSEDQAIWWVTNKLIWDNSVLFKVLSAVKAAAFFLAIIMIVVTWFKVISAWDGEKWKKLVKWIVNVVVALLVIKWVDFIYYMAADSQNFVQNAADFIINVAKIFGYIYGVIIVLMVIVAWYLYITDGGTGNNFKKASNVLVNILLSWLVLFSFLLILYQVFAEFQTWGDAVLWNESQQTQSSVYSSNQWTTNTTPTGTNGWWWGWTPTRDIQPQGNNNWNFGWRRVVAEETFQENL